MLRRYHGISIAKSMLVLTLSSKMWICYSCVNGAWLGKAQGQERQPLMVHVSLSPQKTHVWPVTSSDGLFLSTLASAAFCRNERKVSNILRNHISPSNCTFQVNPDPRVQTDLSSLLHGPAASVISFSSWDLNLNRGPPDESQLGNGKGGRWDQCVQRVDIPFHAGRTVTILSAACRAH